MPQPRIIALFGPDGSGKSTHLKLLQLTLQNKGYRSRYVWLCSHHLLAWLLCKSFVSLGCYIIHSTNTKYPPRSVSQGKVGRYIWLFAEVISLAVVDLYKVRLKSFRSTIIIERYIPGALADMVYMFDESFLDSFSARLILSLIRKDALLIMLHTDYAEIVKRRGSIAEPLDYIETQKKVYTWFSKRYPCKKIESSQPIDEVSRIIEQLIQG